MRREMPEGLGEGKSKSMGKGNYGRARPIHYHNPSSQFVMDQSGAED